MGVTSQGVLPWVLPLRVYLSVELYLRVYLGLSYTSGCTTVSYTSGLGSLPGYTSGLGSSWFIPRFIPQGVLFPPQVYTSGCVIPAQVYAPRPAITVGFGTSCYSPVSLLVEVILPVLHLFYTFW